MATLAETFSSRDERPDLLSGTPRAHSIDRWIFVFMAAWFIAIVLTGFIPDSVMKVGMVQAGGRPPFPPVLHMHALVMGSFLLVLLTQTSLMATGRKARHMQIGLFGMGLAALLVVVGAVLAPTMYYQTWNALQAAPPAQRGPLHQLLSVRENILLLQMRAGLLFPLFLAIGFRARGADAGLHKRMMILATAVPLGAAFARMTWLPTTMPYSGTSLDVMILVAVAPMFAWDLIRNRSVHRAYWIWLPIFVVTSAITELLWDTPWWHATAQAIMRV
jgi:hypothetical protein